MMLTPAKTAWILAAQVKQAREELLAAKQYPIAWMMIARLKVVREIYAALQTGWQALQMNA